MRGENYRLLTAPLIHLNGWYLGTNIVILFAIGKWVEKVAGRVVTLYCCLAGTIGAALFFSMFSSYQYVVGSSSLIFALLGFSGFIQIFCRKELPLIYQVEIIDLYAIGATLFLLHALIYWIDAPVSISAHTGAFWGGFVVGIAVVRRFKVNPT
jgi:membrane associated rhomboid family serine protease